MTVNQHVSHHASQALRFRKTALALALGQILALSAPVALAATIDVGVSGCTLEDAITAANSDADMGSCSASGWVPSGADTIVLTSNATITLSAPLPVVTSTITIEGNGATIQGNNSFRIFTVNGGSLTLAETTISGGSADYGGGIYVHNNGALMLTNSTVSGNSAYYSGGGVYASGSTVTLTNSTVSGNSADEGGGGILLYGSTVTSSISSSTISGNSAAFGGGIAVSFAAVTLTNSTVSGNSANLFGGGILIIGSAATLTNSTVSGNSANLFGGGISAKYYEEFYSTLTLTNSTISENSAYPAGGGGGVFFGKYVSGDGVQKKRLAKNKLSVASPRAAAPGNSFTLQNTIIANSTGGDCVNSSSITPTNTNSLIVDGGTNCGTPLLTVDPNLGPLANNGGATQTHALKKGSSAIDRILSASGCGVGVTTDQRGITRPQGAQCDIGAFELRAPIAVDDSYNTPHDQALTVPIATGVLSNDTNPENSSDNPLTALKLTDPAHGTVTLNADGSFTYTPANGYVGPDSFTYKANNGTDSTAATVTINVINDAPVAVNDSYSTVRNQPLTVAATGVLTNDTDPNGDTLTALKLTDPAHGTVTLNADGSFTYTPTSGYVGPDSFTYKANDGNADSNTATVTINVTNGAPIAANDSYSTARNQPLTVAATGVLTNDTDPNGDALTALKVSDPAHGAVTLNADGSFTYTPTSGYVGSDSFTYKANDGNADSNTATVTITINSGAPTANPDSYSTGVNQKLTVPAPGVLSNDDANGNTTLTVAQVSGPSHGTLNLQSDGGFVYTPTTGFVGQDTFTYQVNGSTAAADQPLSKAKASGVIAADGISAPATVTITISAEIPTLSEWAQMAAAALLTLLGWLGLRRRTSE